MILERLPMPLTVCKVTSIREIDLDAGFCFIGKTDEELSLVCETKDVPASAAEREDGWRAFRVRGVLDFSLVGILAGLTRALAERGIGLFAVSTFNTDYLLVRDTDADRAEQALREAGNEVVRQGEGRK